MGHLLRKFYAPLQIIPPASRPVLPVNLVLGIAGTVDKYYIWEIISYAWTEIGIESDECQKLVQKGSIMAHDLKIVDRIIFRDVCASFAFDTFLIFPLMLWMIMPDWGYGEEYLRKRMDRWYSRPYLLNILNPMRWFGYPLAVLMALKYRAMLRKAVLLSMPIA